VSSADPRTELANAVRDPGPEARRWRDGGGVVVGTIGAAVPHEVVAAAGALPVRLPRGGSPGRPSAEPPAEARFQGTGLDRETARQLAALVDGTWDWLDALVIGRDTEAHGKLWAVLRELGRTGGLKLPVACVDVAWTRRPASARYNRINVDQLCNQLVAWFGTPVTDRRLRLAFAEANATRRRLRALFAARNDPDGARLAGRTAFDAVAAARVLRPTRHAELVEALAAAPTPPRPGPRVLLAGSVPADGRVYDVVEAGGATVVGEDHDRGVLAVAAARDLAPDDPDPRGAVAARWHAGPPAVAFSDPGDRAAALAYLARVVRADVVLYLVQDGDPAAGWDVPAVTSGLAADGVPLVVAHDDEALSRQATWRGRLAARNGGDAAGPTAIRDRAVASAARPRVTVRTGPTTGAAAVHNISTERRNGGALAVERGRRPAGARGTTAPAPAPPASVDRRPGSGPAPTARAMPALAVTARIAEHQRAWFAEVRERAAAGEPIAVVNADVPHELFRALDIPYVVNQWWSSLISAKQRAPDALAALAEAGYPDTSEQYNALGLGEVLLDDPAGQPWGGLPAPAVLCAARSSDAMGKLFGAWAERTGARLVTIERTVDTRSDPDPRWWARLPDAWDEELAAERLDLAVADIEALIVQLEEVTGRRLDRDRLAAILDLVNEHETWYGRARDLVAATVPAPVSIADTVPATMIPQWHRGTVWGRDAARAFHDEIHARVAAGRAACPGERMRLMWLGRGLWSDLGLYRHAEERHGAVFVWSMYLALAADGYVRRWRGDPAAGTPDRDPLRALAARYVPMGDELRMPTWSAAWHGNEARSHHIDGVVSLGEDDWFSVRALEAAGIPVLRLDQDNTDRRGEDPAALRAAIDRFIEQRVAPVAARRRKEGP
jgi:benzoyl-CoA reductase/2-hydroxyglutaryl-CoA dehydratase subunit BcrC/BadD/HgdB